MRANCYRQRSPVVESGPRDSVSGGVQDRRIGGEDRMERGDVSGDERPRAGPMSTSNMDQDRDVFRSMPSVRQLTQKFGSTDRTIQTINDEPVVVPRRVSPRRTYIRSAEELTLRERKSIYIAPFICYAYLKALTHGSHSFTCKYTMPVFPS